MPNTWPTPSTPSTYDVEVVDDFAGRVQKEVIFHRRFGIRAGPKAWSVGNPPVVIVGRVYRGSDAYGSGSPGSST